MEVGRGEGNTHKTLKRAYIASGLYYVAAAISSRSMIRFRESAFSVDLLISSSRALSTLI